MTLTGSGAVAIDHARTLLSRAQPPATLVRNRSDTHTLSMFHENRGCSCDLDMQRGASDETEQRDFSGDVMGVLVSAGTACASGPNDSNTVGVASLLKRSVCVSRCPRSTCASRRLGSGRNKPKPVWFISGSAMLLVAESGPPGRANSDDCAKRALPGRRLPPRRWSLRVPWPSQRWTTRRRSEQRSASAPL